MPDLSTPMIVPGASFPHSARSTAHFHTFSVFPLRNVYALGHGFSPRTSLSSSTARAAASYDYHLEKKADATSESCYEIKNNSTSEVVDGDYTIDDHFNIKSADGAVDTNLFCGDTPYFQFPTDFLYITKSTDNGATWSAPQLVDAKNESEQVFLIGPGRGITTSTGRLIFPCYQYTSGVQRTSTIYSDDEGITWHRGATEIGRAHV